MKTNHIHKLKRHVYKTGAKTYFCTLDCTFRVACELALGKHAICWRCGREFALNSYSITLAKPHCEECHIHKSESKAKLRRKDDPIVENVTKQIGSAVIGSLRERLDKIAHGVSVANDSADKVDPTKIEYKTLEEEDEFL